MDNIQEMDGVLQRVRQSAQQFGVPSDAVITQQILLLGNSFFSYRFTAVDFAAIWSAVDQKIKVYDHEERFLAMFSPSETVEETSGKAVALQRRAA